ncbi:MAG: CDP-diacylglycerol--serine O-phosphatidyltransferase [Acidaminococcaceae bacterium]|jgi:CDP-diacylglycerol--serine O-phosphatidyltransferase|nr:CDP-diacylglycerol--serine O-phosphatidyltransferase [Acidaminococcaceae bacterium]
MNYKRIVPNTISGISLVLGVISIFYTIEKDFSLAAICIILSVVADSLDGRAARLLGVSGPFGVEMDSMCDLGAFGVAPAILIYQFGLTDLGWLGKFIAGFYTFMGAMRLARFNVNVTAIHGYFQGMPIPAGACVLATYVLSGFNFSTGFTALLTFATACILYSNVKFPDFKGHGNPMFRIPVIIAVVIGVALLFHRPAGWPFVCMFTYFIAGIINALYVLLFVKQ